MKPQPLSQSKSIKMLVNARSGWGKTRLLGSSPGENNLIIRPPIDYNDSILPADRKRWQELVAKDWTAMEEVFEYLRHEGDKHDWVWFDSISGYQDIGLDDIWENLIIEKPHRKKYGLDKGEYGINMQRLGRWVRDVATLSDSGMFNFGMTAWPAELSPNPEDSEVEEKMMPWVQGKNMSMKMCGYMNIVAFGDYTAKGSRILRFMESEHIYAKCQFDGTDAPGSVRDLGYKMVNPSMPKVIDMVEKGKGANNPRRTRAKRTAKRGGRMSK